MSLTVQKQKGETKDELIFRFKKQFLDEDIDEEIKKTTCFVSKARQKYERRRQLKRQGKFERMKQIGS